MSRWLIRTVDANRSPFVSHDPITHHAESVTVGADEVPFESLHPLPVERWDDNGAEVRLGVDELPDPTAGIDDGLDGGKFADTPEGLPVVRGRKPRFERDDGDGLRP